MYGSVAQTSGAAATASASSKEATSETAKPAPNTSEPAVHGLVAVVCAVAIGFVFGFAMDKAKVTVPSVLRAQMVFRSEVMMKMFLGATAIGTLAVAVMSALHLAKRVAKGPRALGFGVMHGYGANVVGGFLLGVGITVTGSCPGTVFAQLGAGYWQGLLVLAGGWVAAAVFGYLHRFFKAAQPRFDVVGEPVYVDSLLKREMLVVAAVFASIIVVVLAVLEHFFPWQSDLAAAITIPSSGHTQAFGDPTAVAWNPIGSGILLGSLQVASFLLFKTSLGTSSSYVTCASYACSMFDHDQAAHAPYFKTFQGSMAHVWQVFLVCGIALGSFVSFASSGFVTVDSVMPMPTVYESFFGGLLLLFGARLAGGCTSGHGISGMAQLSLPSFVTTCMMLVGALGTGFAFYR